MAKASYKAMTGREQKKGSDVRTVNIGIRHDHDLVIAKFAYIEIISISFRKTTSKCIDHRFNFCIRKNFIHRSFLYI